MGIGDFLFGEAPSTTESTLPTLTPEQQQLLQSLIGSFNAAGGADAVPPEFGGDLNVAPSGVESASLAALEQRALQLQDPSAVDNAAAETLRSLLDFEGQQQDVSELFQTNIRDPALANFAEDVLPQISRSFGGSNFFSSERAETDRSAQEGLIDSLTRSRTQLEFDAFNTSRNRALQAAGLVPGVSGARTNELLGIFGAGREATGLQERNIGREFTEFTRQQEEQARRIRQILATLGIQGQENIVTVDPGSSGFLTEAAGGAAAGAAGAFLSSEELKKNIKPFDGPVLDKIMELPIQTWEYVGTNTPHSGPMAEKFTEVFGVGNGREIAVVDVMGILMKGLQELAEKANGNSSSTTS